MPTLQLPSPDETPLPSMWSHQCTAWAPDSTLTSRVGLAAGEPGRWSSGVATFRVGEPSYFPAHAIIFPHGDRVPLAAASVNTREVSASSAQNFPRKYNCLPAIAFISASFPSPCFHLRKASSDSTWRNQRQSLTVSSWGRSWM